MSKPLSKEYLASRGKCCHNGCQNCPWNGGMDPKPPYWQRCLVAVSQVLNVVVLNGWPDEMVSSRAYRLKWTWMIKLIDTAFFWQFEHCRQSYEWEQQRRDSPQY